MKIWLWLLILVLFGYTRPALASDNSITFTFDSASGYYTSLISLREAVGDPIPGLSNNVRITRNDNSVTIIKVDDVPGVDVQLVVLNRNLYTAGFIVTRNGVAHFYRFSDMASISVPGVPESNIITLNVTGAYPQLEPRANTSRERLRVSTPTFESAIRTLYNQPVGSNTVTELTARALLTLIVSVSEAARFPEISTWVVGSIIGGSQSVPMGQERRSITNQWASVSGFALQAAASRVTTNYISNAWRRPIPDNQLANILAIALCRPSASSRQVSAGLSHCDAIMDNVVIGNRIFERRTFLMLIDDISLL